MTPGLPARLAAPNADRAVVAHPSTAEWSSLVRRNAQARQAWEWTLFDARGSDLNRQARVDLVAAAWNYTRQYRDVVRSPAEGPVVLAGHQPQLFHPGVWVKHAALSGLARSTGGQAVNLVVDSDTLNSTALRVPTGTPERPRAAAIEFDDAGTAIPWEERAVLNGPLFAGFASRVADAIAGIVPDPFLRAYWPSVLEAERRSGNLGAAFSQARHAWEGVWGLSTLELPESRVAEFFGFRVFVAWLLVHGRRFLRNHNGALEEHRKQFKVRSRNHPVPALAEEGAWVEAPLWIWDRANPRRRRVFAQTRQGEVVVSDRETLEVVLPLSEEQSGERAAEAVQGIAGSGIKLRTRALATTLFARMFLGDLFVHGIGGAKYDRLTDELIRRLFDIAPPAYSVVSATLLLPVARNANAGEELRAARRAIRSCEFHPETFLGAHPPPEAVRLAESKRRWVETPQTMDNARERCRAIRAANAGLADYLAAVRARLASEAEAQAMRAAGEEMLCWREYGFCLYPERILRDFLLEFASASF
jgi:hypothetical protein